MPRKPNDLKTAQITISTTPGIEEYLKVLVSTHLYGKNPADAAVRLLEKGIENLLKDGTLKRQTFGRSK